MKRPRAPSPPLLRTIACDRRGEKAISTLSSRPSRLSTISPLAGEKAISTFSWRPSRQLSVRNCKRGALLGTATCHPSLQERGIAGHPPTCHPFRKRGLLSHPLLPR